jgi:hypothetical protein
MFKPSFFITLPGLGRSTAAWADDTLYVSLYFRLRPATVIPSETSHGGYSGPTSPNRRRRPEAELRARPPMGEVSAKYKTKKRSPAGTLFVKFLLRKYFAQLHKYRNPSKYANFKTYISILNFVFTKLVCFSL